MRGKGADDSPVSSLGIAILRSLSGELSIRQRPRLATRGKGADDSPASSLGIAILRTFSGELSIRQRPRPATRDKGANVSPASSLGIGRHQDHRSGCLPKHPSAAFPSVLRPSAYIPVRLTHSRASDFPLHGPPRPSARPFLPFQKASGKRGEWQAAAPARKRRR